MERFREEEGLRHKEELKALSGEIQLLKEKEKEKEWRSGVEEVRRDQSTQISSLTAESDREETDGQMRRRRRRRGRETDNQEEGGEVSRRRSNPLCIDNTVE